MKKIFKYTLITLSFTATILICAGYYLIGVALKPQELVTRSRNMEASFEHIFHDYPETKAWIDSLQDAGAWTDLYMEADEGQRQMHAYYMAAARPTHRTAVIVHGYTDNAARMLPIGYLYHKVLGYNILLPDLYGHGLSEGNEVRMGWKDRLDVLQWMEKAEELVSRQLKEDDIADSLQAPVEMVVHGISMGAATTMMVSGEVEHGTHQLPYVKCFVEDCGYTSAWDEFAGELKVRYHLPPFPLLHIASLFCKYEYGWSFQEASALEQVRKCNLPMLFIHGDADTFVPTWMVHPLFEAKPQPKELWIVPGIDHAHSYRDSKEEYTTHVKQFVEKYIQ